MNEAKNFPPGVIEAMKNLSSDSGKKVVVTKMMIRKNGVGFILDGVGVQLVDEDNQIVKKAYIPTKIV